MQLRTLYNQRRNQTILSNYLSGYLLTKDLVKLLP
jgi:hypothetical protein